MIHLLVGVQGSGKSTFAKQFSKECNCEVVSTDEIRKSNPNISEKEVWPTVYQTLAKALNENRDAIFDATSISKKVRKRFFDEVGKYCDEVKAIAYYFKTDVNECVKRVEQRNKGENEIFIPLDVIYSYQEKLEIPETSEGFYEVKYVIDGKIYREEA